MKPIKYLLVLLFLTSPMLANSQTWRDADVNNDGKLDVVDIKSIVSVMGGDKVYALRADVNKDGSIDVVDVVAAIYIMSDVDAAVIGDYCPDRNHPHVIDMGTAGKWACCNVGATAPWKTGGYYCWGGTKELSFYGATPENETACIWGEGTMEDGSDWWGYKWGMWDEDGILLPAYDVARVKWGGSWHIPKIERYEKLNSEYGFRKEATKLNGTPGVDVFAPNGNKLFLPYCGQKSEDKFYYDQYAPPEYWSSEAQSTFQGMIFEPDAGAMHLNFAYYPDEEFIYFEEHNSDFVKTSKPRGVGLPVRAVQ